MDLNKFRDVDLVIDKANANFIQKQFVSQGDLKGRTLTVQITDRGVIGEVPGLTLNLRWTNTTSGLTDLSAFECIDQANSLFRIEYPTNMLTPGKVQANIQIIDGEKVTHLKTFEITVQRLSGEMVGVTGQAEYGALVAVLADANKFRTDIDFLGMDKASKEEVNQLATDKASNASLANSNKRIDGLASSKVDKGGNEQVTLPMLSQEVKTAMTGGSVAVVGAGAVNTSNIVDGSVTTAKVESAVATPLFVYPNKTKPNYDTKTKTLTIPHEDGLNIYFLSGSQWKAVEMEEDILVDSSALEPTSLILVFDFDTLTFNWQRWYDALSKTQIPIASMRGNGKALHSPYFEITVDGKQAIEIPDRSIDSVQTAAYVPNVIVAYVNSEWPSYNKTTATLKIPKSTDGNVPVIFCGNESVMLPNEEILVPMGDTPQGTSKLVFDFDTTRFFWETWYYKLTSSQVVLATMRGNGKALHSPYFKITIDGENMEAEPSIIPVPANAPIKNIWHRGYSKKYPENTLLAFKAAKKFGCNMVEMDLEYTADKVPVCIHDPSLNRTGRNLDGSPIDGNVNIYDITYEETKNYEFGSWKDGKFLGEKLPTLEECLLLCKRLDLTFCIDRAWYMDRAYDKTKEIINRVGHKKIIYQVNSPGGAQTFRNLFPGCDMFFLLASGTDITQEAIDTCVQYKLSDELGEGICEILTTGNLATQPAIQNALDAGVKVNLWGADNIDRDQYAEWGVTGFQTNGINIIQEILEDI